MECIYVFITSIQISRRYLSLIFYDTYIKMLKIFHDTVYFQHYFIIWFHQFENKFSSVVLPDIFYHVILYVLPVLTDLLYKSVQYILIITQKTVNVCVFCPFSFSHCIVCHLLIIPLVFSNFSSEGFCHYDLSYFYFYFSMYTFTFAHCLIKLKNALLFIWCWPFVYQLCFCISISCVFIIYKSHWVKWLKKLRWSLTKFQYHYLWFKVYYRLVVPIVYFWFFIIIIRHGEEKYSRR